MLLAPCGFRPVVDDLHIQQALNALFQRGRRFLRIGVADRSKIAGLFAHFLHDAQHMHVGAVIERDMRVIRAGRIQALHPAAVAVLHFEQTVHAAHRAVKILLLLCLLIGTHQEPDLRGGRIVVDRGMRPVAGMRGHHALLPAALALYLLLNAGVCDGQRLLRAEPVRGFFQIIAPRIILLRSADRHGRCREVIPLREHSCTGNQQHRRTDCGSRSSDPVFHR